jgi:hypothetical protein
VLRRNRVLLLTGPLIAAGLALWTYWPAFDSYLIDDDFQWIDGAMQLVASHAFAVSGRTHFYRPILELYFSLMYALFACSALALHVGSVCIHIVNAWLVMLLALRMTRDADHPDGSRVFAPVAGILFAVQPGPAQAVLWPSAVGTLLSATFGLLFILADMSSRTMKVRAATQEHARTAIALLAFAASMGAHESGVMWLPAAVLLRYGLVHCRDGYGGQGATTRAVARHYGPALFLLFAYAGLTAWINSHNYVITEGQYRPGTHMITNLLMYLVALYAGRQRWIEYVAVAVLIVVGVWRGTPLVRAWCLWLIAALLPMLPFMPPPSSRYLYVSAITFSFLAAFGIVWIATILRERGGPRGHVAAVTSALLLTTFVAGRSASFARKGAEGFRHDAARYFDLAAHLDRRDTDVSWIQPLYLDPLARVAACNPLARYENLR